MGFARDNYSADADAVSHSRRSPPGVDIPSPWVVTDADLFAFFRLLFRPVLPVSLHHHHHMGDQAAGHTMVKPIRSVFHQTDECSANLAHRLLRLRLDRTGGEMAYSDPSHTQIVLPKIATELRRLLHLPGSLQLVGLLRPGRNTTIGQEDQDTDVIKSMWTFL